jgi:hypothetical protein
MRLAARITITALIIGWIGVSSAGAQPMFGHLPPSTMQVVGDQVILSGLTDIADHDRLKRLLDENEGKITAIVLRNRLGGAAIPTYRMMYMIRTRGLRTVVSGGCGSACAYTFLAGVGRHLAAESRVRRTRLGYHPAYGYNLVARRDSVPVMVEIVLDYTGGRADRRLLSRMVEFVAARDFLVFDDPAWSPQPDGVSVFLCKCSANFQKMREECEPIRDPDGYAQGLLTSRERIKINTAIGIAGDQVHVSGEFGPGDDRRLDEVLDHGSGTLRTVVFRDGAGNDSDTGDRMARSIRQRGLATAISGYCIAARARAFLGGVERQLTSEKALERTYLALGGDYDDNGTPIAVRLDDTRRRIVDYTGGNATAAVLDRLKDLPGPEGSLFFFDPRVKTYDGDTIFVCSGSESRRVADCEPIKSTTSREQGIFTSAELLRVKFNALPR